MQDDRLAQAIAADAAAAIELDRLAAVLEAAKEAHHRALTLNANGDRALREAYDRVIAETGAEHAAADREYWEQVGRVAGVRRALRALSAEVGA